VAKNVMKSVISLSLGLLMSLLCAPLAHAQESAAGIDGLPHGFDAGWKGMKTCTVLFETPEVRVGQCSFAPGVGHEKHYHNPHFGYVLEGSTMLIQDSSGEHEVTTQTGSSWSTTTVTIHEAINSGTTHARYLIIEPRPEVQP
jgi:quercetin dioxygenase-like cupin family protein